MLSASFKEKFDAAVADYFKDSGFAGKTSHMYTWDNSGLVVNSMLPFGREFLQQLRVIALNMGEGYKQAEIKTSLEF
jgi:hypothetical protein